MDSSAFTTEWLSVAGKADSALARQLRESVAARIDSGEMPPNEPTRVAETSTAIARGSFVVSSERLELLRGLCQIYSAGIRAEKITSHRKFIGPVIVFVKRSLFRVIASLLGPSFRFQRDFNAGVIRLLGDLCNEAPNNPKNPDK
jgi:hypothetical protein